jgi:Zn-dependent peptidase ImmA (M78 family)
MAMTRNKIRELVEGILNGCAVKAPPVPVEAIIRRQGINIARKSLDDDTSGFVYVDSRTNSTVIGLNVSHSKTRQRFTLAHELGHFLMHKTSGGHLHVDEKDFFVRFRDKHSGDGSDQQEREANAFAAELLMPTTFLERDIKHLKDGVSISDEKAIRSMANRYGVSLQALLFRLGNLDCFEGSFSL